MSRMPKPWYRKDRKSWFVTVNGKRHNLGPDRKTAFQRFHELMASPAPPNSVQTNSVLAIVDAFLEWTAKHRAPRTYDWYLERCQSFVDAVSNTHLTVNQLKPYHLQQWLDAHDSWSNGHKRGCITALKRTFNWAMKMGYWPHNPVAAIEKPPAAIRDRVVSRDEFDRILSLVDDQEFRDLLTIAWDTGCRPQEAWGVEARHVELANSRWVIPVKEAKGQSYPRIVYLTEAAQSITERYLIRNPDGKLLRNTRNRPWTRFAVNCRFDRLKQKLGVKYCLYLFRHTFATRMLEAGVDALSVAILLGHTNPTMLSTTYQHLGHNPRTLLQHVRRVT